MRFYILSIAMFFYCLNIGYAQSFESDSIFEMKNDITASAVAGNPSGLPNIKYHLTARPWNALNISKSKLLDEVEGIVREIAKYQNSNGAIIDPYANREVQYATPYFANAVGTLLSAGRATDLLNAGVAAMNKASLDVSEGASSIPDNHGEFFLAPLANAIPLYTTFVSASQIQAWKSRMSKPVEDVIRGLTHNWRTYAMKGEWYRAKNGYVNKGNAISWIESSWVNTQKTRFTNNTWNFYHDQYSDPLPWPYESVSRSNLLAIIIDGYEGTSRSEILNLLKKGTQSSLLMQDPSGQGTAGGRSGDHTWNDILLANGFEIMAEITYKEGNTRLAGQYRHAAALAFQSVKRWKRSNGSYFVTKNHFDPANRIGYATYSFFTNYNGNMMYHLAENYLRHKTSIKEQPTPNEIGGYTVVSDNALATAVANAGGMFMEVGLRGSAALNYNRYWNTLGVIRFSRPGWDSRLGPSDGVRETSSKEGVSFSPVFSENGAWLKIASVPDRYEAFFSTQFVHPLLVRCRVEYKPKSGKTGPTFTNNFIIIPDGILSTLTSSNTNFGIIWPILTYDGATTLSTKYSSYIASTSFPDGTDQQNFIALHSSPKITATDATRRSSYGDLRPVRMVSGTYSNVTFIYPRSASDPSADSVRKSFVRSGNDFSSVLGKVKGNLYVGRTSAGGVGTSIDVDNDGKADATFDISTGFVMQMTLGEITKIETDRAVTAVIYGQTLDLRAYTPVSITNPLKASIKKVEASADDGNVATNTIDQEYGTRWSVKGDNQWIRYHLDTTIVIKTVKIAWYKGNERQASFSILTSLDGAHWKTIFSGYSSGNTTFSETYSLTPTSARYIQILGHGNNLDAWNSITEVVILKDSSSLTRQFNLKTSLLFDRELTVNNENAGTTSDMKIWPNPGTGILNLQVSPNWVRAELEVYDIMGKVCKMCILDNTSILLNLSNLNKGVYVIRLVKNKKVVNRKIVLQ